MNSAKPNRAMYEVLSFPHVKVLAMSESGNIAWKSSEMSSFPLYDWCFVTVFNTHRTSAFNVEVDPKALVALDVAGQLDVTAAGQPESRDELGPGSDGDQK